MVAGSRVLVVSCNAPPNLKGRKMAALKKWNIEDIICWFIKNYPNMTRKKAIDLFADAVENYKNCDYKSKLEYEALSFIYAANICRIDFLTGSQAFEVANNVATDFGADKKKVQNRINDIMKNSERGKYDKRYGL